ncbi:putative heterokaryon incompatibility protein [Parachaetomium inaequale]|uniref:Heterokaryon incompatibility protein n=1 Tax=Parachaetomium inaequale TaxID=2588326 RepID=A0AAN6P4E9_9PEZI|nr:putative heterokaryon incompatibility protein [Parachaetomium inaequale]
MSINQKDSADIAAQVSVMGEIYSGAERVSVLLPESDKEAFDVLADLLSMATTLLSRKGQFDRTQAVEQWPANGPGSFTDTGMIAKRFFTVMDDFQTKLREYQYWMRAWTFQEWATAHDIEVGLDIPGEERRPVLQKVKSTIVYVAIMITDYKLRQGQYARMDIGLTRGLAKPKLDQIKRLFPFENAFASPNEIPDAEIRFQTLMPNAGTSALLGLRSNPGQPRTAEEQFSARLRLMLDSFTGMHRRKATFEADMVCCWASMCNIAYHYSKDDSLPVALAKVTRALRQRGVKLYNFTSNGQPEQDIDLAFFAYSAAHEQVNAINMAPFPDAPIFSGRADTVKHFVTSLAACHKRHANIPHAASGDVPVQAVAGAVVALATSLSDLPSLLKAFSSATSGGDGDGMMFTSLMPLLVAALARLSAQMIETSAFILAAVPVRRGDRREYLRLWAVCPSWVVVEEGDLYVAREGLNGTLVLVKESTRRSIVAYLTVTDTRCGTFLAPVSEHGRLEILLRAPIRSDILSSGDQADRRLSATLELVDPSVVASDRCGRELLWQSFGDMAASTSVIQS